MSVIMTTMRRKANEMAKRYRGIDLNNLIWDLIEDWDAAVLGFGDGNGFASWCDTMVDNVPAAERKALSYDGAVRSRSSDPVHYTDYRGMPFFDPGNLTYSRAFHSLVMYANPNFNSTQGNWNNKTKGDLIEAALGAAWRNPADPEWASFRDRLEAVVYATIALENALADVDVEVGKNAMLWADFVDELRIVLRRRQGPAA